jgi:hypothetical protein
VVHELVERIYGRFTGNVEAAWTELPTISTTLLIDDPEHRVRVYRPSHLKAWTERLIRLFEQSGPTLLTQLSDPQDIERTYNDLTIDPPAYVTTYTYQEAFRGLILAKLLEREDLAAIAAFHHRHLAALDGLPYRDFEAYILSTSRDELIARASTK